MPLSRFAADVASYFFSELAPRYDLRERLHDIQLPTLVIAGEYDWVCPPVHSRTRARPSPTRALQSSGTRDTSPSPKRPGSSVTWSPPFIGDLHNGSAQEHWRPEAAVV